MGLVDVFVEHGMMQGAMDPVYEIVGKHQEAVQVSAWAKMHEKTYKGTENAK